MDDGHRHQPEDFPHNDNARRHPGSAGAFQRPIAAVERERNRLPGKPRTHGGHRQHNGEPHPHGIVLLYDRQERDRHQHAHRDNETQQQLLAMAEKQFRLNDGLGAQHGAGAGAVRVGAESAGGKRHVSSLKYGR